MSTTDDFFESQRLLIKTTELIQEATQEERERGIQQLLMDSSYPAGIDVHQGFGLARDFFIGQNWSFDLSAKRNIVYMGKEVLVVSSQAHPSIEITADKLDGVPTIYLACTKFLPGKHLIVTAPNTKEEVYEMVRTMVRELLVKYAPSAS